MVSLGCAKNLVDSEIMLGMLRNEYEITADEKAADVIIINTCGFIDTAKEESINTILEMAQHKEKNCKCIIVTGCLAERYRDEILQEIPEVDAVIGTGNYSDIINAVNNALAGQKYVNTSPLKDVDYLDKERVVSTGEGFAYLKIAEGCDNYCTYCIIPSLRGRLKSRKIESIVNEARWLADNGYREIILVAQDTSRYGLDIYGKKMLAELLRKLGEIKDLLWIRVLYCYPEAIDDELINEFLENDKVCKYLDIPIQHFSDRILKMMGRRGTSKDILNVIEKVRKKIPGIILRTTMIVGFPGEKEEDFDILCNFIKNIKFDRLGVFTYSREENTPAAGFPDQVDEEVKLERYNKLMSIQKKIAVAKNKKRVGKVYPAIVEGLSEDGIFYFGRTYAEAPDVDSKVYFTSQEPLKEGSFVNVKILNSDEYDLIGEVINEFAE